MLIAIGNWNICKAEEDEKTVRVRMVANSLRPDREDEEILPQAFDKATVQEFVENGIIDWHHQSVLGKTPEDRARAILGKPYSFAWENSKPVVYATLTKANPIVSDAILPHIEAKQAVFGASVGGSVKKAQTVVDTNTKKPKRQILALSWNHLAIAALPYVISPGTAVEMVKAYGRDDMMIRFTDISEFVEKSWLLERQEAIVKALEVGSGTDIATLTGGDALREQSLEGVVSEIIMRVTDGTIKPHREDIEDYLFERGYTSRQISNIIDRFRQTVRDFVGRK